jgi:drug/metabolite transporter (DMT)-like permease
MQMSLSQWLLLVFLSILWGGTIFFVGVAVKELPAFTLVLVRVAMAAAALAAIVLAMGLRFPASLGAWRPFFVMAILNNVIPFVLIARGQQEIASGLASVLNATKPLWSVILGHILTEEEKLKANRLAGVLVGIAGVAVLIGPETLLGSPASVFGMLCVLGATISYGFAGVWGRRFKGMSPLLPACCQLACSTLLLIPLALFIDRPWGLAMPSTRTVWAIVGLALLSTVLAYIVFFHIMAVSGPTNTMLVTLLIPVSAILFGTLFLDETLLPRHIAGTLVIGFSLLLIDGRLFGAHRRSETTTRP